MSKVCTIATTATEPTAKVKTLLAAIAAAALLIFGITLLPISANVGVSTAYADETRLDNVPFNISPDDVAQFGWMQYKFFRAPDGYTAGIWAVLDDDEELPAYVQIAVPEGADVFWFGPVPAGGVTPESPQFPDSHIFHDVENGIYVYTTVLTDSRQLQIEHYFWGEAFSFPVRTLPNGNHSIRIDYTPLNDVETLRLAAFLPEGSRVIDHLNVIPLGVGPTGDPAFAVEISDAQGLENYSVEIEYAPPEITARQNQPTLTEGFVTVIIMVTVAITLALVFILFIRLRKGHRAD